MLPLRIALVLCALVGLSIWSEAADPPKGSPPLPAEQEKFIDSIFERMDANKDGKISKDEAKGQILQNFDRIDRNKDGFVDREELRLMVRAMAANGKAKGKFGPGGKFDGPPPGSGRFPDFDSLDKNADGRLTRDEVKGTSLERVFDEIDANKDGKIDPKEYEAYKKKEAKP